MSEDATSVSNAKLDEIIKGSQTPGEMQELLRQYNLEQSARGAQAPPPSLPPQPREDDHGGRTAPFLEVLYLSGNDRVEISGFSQAEIEKKKAAIYAAYGIKR